ncbi:hypothetical protein SDC9_211075 [bioreactor metagenome]|uniref:Uncharacterized protein n=1 Tax=bioreactor metagenome TaxID=1076179 RepID=A0A645JIZ5_9ZZZZ
MIVPFIIHQVCIAFQREIVLAHVMNIAADYIPIVKAVAVFHGYQRRIVAASGKLILDYESFVIIGKIRGVQKPSVLYYYSSVIKAELLSVSQLDGVVRPLGIEGSAEG